MLPAARCCQGRLGGPKGLIIFDGTRSVPSSRTKPPERTKPSLPSSSTPPSSSSERSNERLLKRKQTPRCAPLLPLCTSSGHSTKRRRTTELPRWQEDGGALSEQLESWPEKGDELYNSTTGAPCTTDELNNIKGAVQLNVTSSDPHHIFLLPRDPTTPRILVSPRTPWRPLTPVCLDID